MTTAVAVVGKVGMPDIPHRGDVTSFVDTRRVPKPLSGRYIWLTTIGGSALVTGFNFLVVHWRYHHLHADTFILFYLTTVALVYKIMHDASKRRADNLQRFMAVAECNHHIRNALQSMTGLAYVNGYQQIHEAVERIEGTLTEILPRVHGHEGKDIEQVIQEVLDERERQFKTLYEHAPVGIEKLSHDGRILMVNPMLCTMLGYSEKELLSKKFEDITHEDDYEVEKEILYDLFCRGCDTISFHKRYLHKDGYSIWAKVSSSLVQHGKQMYRISVIDRMDEQEIRAWHANV